MQDRPLAHLRHGRARRRDPFESRLRRLIRRERLLVGGFDRRVMDQARELAGHLWVALAGRRPFDLHGRAARRPDRLGERRQADVHDL